MPHRLLNANIALLEQGAGLLASIDDEAYVKVGMRHDRVDYDIRERDQEVESRRSAGFHVIQQTISWLSKLDDDALERPLITRMDCGDGRVSAADWTPSTLASA